MPLKELVLETTDDVGKVHGIVLETLARKGYKVRLDSGTKIIAKHPATMTIDRNVGTVLKSFLLGIIL